MRRPGAPVRRSIADIVYQLVDEIRSNLPRPTMSFRHRAWDMFERALDPFASPRKLRLPPRRPDG